MEEEQLGVEREKQSPFKKYEHEPQDLQQPEQEDFNLNANQYQAQRACVMRRKEGSEEACESRVNKQVDRGGGQESAHNEDGDDEQDDNDTDDDDFERDARVRQLVESRVDKNAYRAANDSEDEEENEDSNNNRFNLIVGNKTCLIEQPEEENNNNILLSQHQQQADDLINQLNDANNNNQLNGLIIKQLARVEHHLATVEEKFRAQDHRLSLIETANREILLKVDHLTLSLETLSNPSAMAAAVAAAAAAAASDPNNNDGNQIQSCESQRHPSAAQQLFEHLHLNSKSSVQQRHHHTQSLFRSIQQATNQHTNMSSNTNSSNNNNNQNTNNSCISASPSVSSSPSMSPVDPQNNLTLRGHSLLGGRNSSSSHLNSTNASTMAGSLIMNSLGNATSNQRDDNSFGRKNLNLSLNHCHSNPLHPHLSSNNNHTATMTTGSSRHSSASVSPSLGPNSPQSNSAAPSPISLQHHQHHQHQHQHHANQLHLSQLGSSSNGNAGGSLLSQQQQQQLAAQVAAAAAVSQQQQADQQSTVAAMASQFLSALARSGGQLGDLDHLTQTHLLASTLGAAAMANQVEVATNLSHAAKKQNTGSSSGVSSSQTGSVSNGGALRNSNQNTSHQASNQLTPQAMAQQLAAASGLGPTTPAAAAAAVAAQLAAATANSRVTLGTTQSMSGSAAGNSQQHQHQVVHTIPHPHSHHALSHPTASLLITNNPPYHTVRTKYSTRRYSRRRVGPEEAMADPAIKATVQLKMPVVPKTILIVLKHRLTVQTAITLACQHTGDRLRKGAIQKKLEAMFREPNAVDAFMAEWDNQSR